MTNRDFLWQVVGNRVSQQGETILAASRTANHACLVIDISLKPRHTEGQHIPMQTCGQGR